MCFAFNGGPGSASVWLHLGALGPKRVQVNDDGSMPLPPYAVSDNPHSWFEHFDLVFVDPPHTGYSIAASEEARKKMLGVDGDVEALAEVMRTWLGKNRRWDSPIYLAGESYGTTRGGGAPRRRWPDDVRIQVDTHGGRRTGQRRRVRRHRRDGQNAGSATRNRAQLAFSGSAPVALPLSPWSACGTRSSTSNTQIPSPPLTLPSCPGLDRWRIMPDGAIWYYDGTNTCTATSNTLAFGLDPANRPVFSATGFTWSQPTTRTEKCDEVDVVLHSNLILIGTATFAQDGSAELALGFEQQHENCFGPSVSWENFVLQKPAPTP